MRNSRRSNSNLGEPDHGNAIAIARHSQTPALLLRLVPTGEAVPAFDRTWLALVLACEVFVGAFLVIAAQFVLGIGVIFYVIFYVLPWMGLETLDTARAAAQFEVPMRVWWGNP